MRWLALVVVVTAMAFSHPARAARLQDGGRMWFHGTTAELCAIRQAMDVLHHAQLQPTGPYSLLAPPLGEDYPCSDSVASPRNGWPYAHWSEQPYFIGHPTDGDCMPASVWWTMNDLGQSVVVNGVIVEIPAYEDLVSYDTLPGVCYGFLFAMECASSDMMEILCPDF
jgi:hypothetical protein